MSDYIKREDAIKAFDPSQRRDWYTPWIVETLQDLPSADVAPVRHGRWIQRKIRESQFVQNGYTRLCCSVCNEYSEGEYHYCPNCGARMDEEADDE